MGLVRRGKRVGNQFEEEEVEDSNCLYRKDVQKMLSSDDFKHFLKWMTGQTCPVMSNGQGGYYLWNVHEFQELIAKLKSRSIDYSNWKTADWLQYVTD